MSGHVRGAESKPNDHPVTERLRRETAESGNRSWIYWRITTLPSFPTIRIFAVTGVTGKLHPTLLVEAEEVRPGRRLTFYPEMKSLLRELRSEIPPIPENAVFRFVYDAISDIVQELMLNSRCRPTSTGMIEQTRLTTDAPAVIEVRLEVKDAWESAEGHASLPFELSGSCHYHLGDNRFSDLKADVVRLSMTEPDGSIRSVKGSHVFLRAGPAYLGAPQIQAERGLLE